MKLSYCKNENKIQEQYGQVNYPYKSSIQNKISFGAGWTRAVEKQIEKCDVAEIVQRLAKQGIESDFKNNKIIAWCSDQVIRIFNTLNKKYKLNLDLPKAIFVEDFATLNIPNKGDRGLCNWHPAHLFSSPDKITGERTVLLNSFDSQLESTPPNLQWLFRWEQIDTITEQAYKEGKISSNHFLHFFIHEFCHSAHNGHLYRQLGSKEMLKKLRGLETLENLEKGHPLEVLANEMAKKIQDSLDDSFSPKYNPFQNALYPKKPSVFRFLSKRMDFTETDKRLGKIWNSMNS